MSRGNFLTLVAAFLSYAAVASLPGNVSVDLEGAYVPIGFDDNDRSQVVVKGTFSNACYKIAEPQVRVDSQSRSIYIDQRAYIYDFICLQIIMPFTQVVDLGILPVGNFTLKDKSSGKTLGTLPVLRAKGAEPDDYLYAPIADASIKTEGANATLTLEGDFTDRCMKLKEVLVHYYRDVIVVQPVAEMLGTPSGCGHELVKFQWEGPLEPGLHGTQLLHVRTMNGQAINRIVGFP